MHLMDDIRTKECQIFAKAWQRWRGASLVPRRSGVRIEEISRLLHLLSVVELVSPEIANFRLAGTSLCEGMGLELTGRNYFDFTTPEARGPRVARTNQLVKHPCGSHFIFPIEYSSGRIVPAEVLSLPVLPNNPSEPPQIFAMSVSLQDMRLDGPRSAPTELPEADGFQFVDIGAGVPDDSLDLTDRAPASLLLKQAS
ncbi:MAG: PAS domain-containing protein [Alphaproteobacteria bacterium]|nr:PAS domain-containing protein [Alphaproteobacteria bacterium]MDP6873890.1 PAS domain-containing protein [Alphaproteobacteria bacterium]